MTGWLTYRALRRVDDSTLEVMLTLALVMGTYAIAQALHASGPIAVVVAGLWIGNHGVRFGMSERTREHVQTFWHLLDEILNAVLFLLIGLEILAIPLQTEALWIAAAAIPLVLLARLLAVAVPIGLLRLRRDFTAGAPPGHDLRGPARRHIGRARPLPARERVQAALGDRHLLHGGLLDHRPGDDLRGRDPSLRQDLNPPLG